MLPALGILLRSVLTRAAPRLLSAVLRNQGAKTLAPGVFRKGTLGQFTRAAIENAPKAQRSVRATPLGEHRGKGGLTLEAVKRLIGRGQSPQPAVRAPGAPQLPEAKPSIIQRITNVFRRDQAPAPKPAAPAVQPAETTPPRQAWSQTIRPEAAPQAKSQNPLETTAPQSKPLSAAPQPPSVTLNVKSSAPQPAAAQEKAAPAQRMPSVSLQPKPAAQPVQQPPTPSGAGSVAPTAPQPVSASLGRAPSPPTPAAHTSAAAPPSQSLSQQQPLPKAPTTTAAQGAPDVKAPPSQSLGQRFSDLFRREPGAPQTSPLSDAFKSVYRFVSRAQPQGSGPPQPGATEERRDFSALASRPGNLAALMSGQKTPDQVRQAADMADKQKASEQQDEAEKQQSAESRQEAIQGLKKLAGAAVQPVGGLVLATVASKKFSESMLASQAHLRQFNGQIGLAFARMQRGDLERSQKSGLARAGSTEELAKAVNQMRNEIRPLADIVANMGNRLGSFAARVVTGTIQALKEIALLRAAMDRLEQEMQKNRPQQMGEWQRFLIQRAAQHKADALKGFKPIRNAPKGPAGGAKGGKA